MGQALRRAAGKVRPSNAQPPAQQLKNAERRPPPPPPERPDTPATGQDGLGVSDTEVPKNKNTSSVLEERDLTYDAMLSQMVGRITSKPGGKPEMGEVVVVGKYDRPLPKLRSSKPASGYHEEKPVPAGTLNVAQLQQIIQLHEGKSEDHPGPMGVEAIAKKFRIEVTQVQKILKFVSLPPEDINKTSEQDQ